jgi:predicted CoA-binding protein
MAAIQGGQMDNLEAARALLARKRLALVGVARDQKDFTRVVQRELVRRGYDVVPVNPAAAVEDALAAEVRRLWFHRLHAYLRGPRR